VVRPDAAYQSDPAVRDGLARHRSAGCSPDGGSPWAYKIESLWKRTLFLNDNHIRWLCMITSASTCLRRACCSRTCMPRCATCCRRCLRLCRPKSRGLVVWNLSGWNAPAWPRPNWSCPTVSTSLSLHSPGDERPQTQINPWNGGRKATSAGRGSGGWPGTCPPGATRAYDVVYSSGPRAEAENSHSSPLVLENSRLRATFAANGEIATLEDKRSGRIYRGGNRLLNLLARPGAGRRKG